MPEPIRRQGFLVLASGPQNWARSMTHPLHQLQLSVAETIRVRDVVDSALGLRVHAACNIAHKHVGQSLNIAQQHVKEFFKMRAAPEVEQNRTSHTTGSSQQEVSSIVHTDLTDAPTP